MESADYKIALYRNIDLDLKDGGDMKRDLAKSHLQQAIEKMPEEKRDEILDQAIAKLNVRPKKQTLPKY